MDVNDEYYGLTPSEVFMSAYKHGRDKNNKSKFAGIEVHDYERG